MLRKCVIGIQLFLFEVEREECALPMPFLTQQWQRCYFPVKGSVVVSTDEGFVPFQSDVWFIADDCRLLSPIEATLYETSHGV